MGKDVITVCTASHMYISDLKYAMCATPFLPPPDVSDMQPIPYLMDGAFSFLLQLCDVRIASAQWSQVEQVVLLVSFLLKAEIVSFF